MLKTKIFEKKGKISSEEKIMDLLFPYYRTLQMSGNLLKSSQGNLTIPLELMRALFLDLKGCGKHKFLRKKDNLSSETNRLTDFSHIIEREKNQITFYKGR